MTRGRKTRLLYIRGRGNNETHTETHKENHQREEKSKFILYIICCNQNCLLVLLGNSNPDPQQATVAERQHYQIKTENKRNNKRDLNPDSLILSKYKFPKKHNSFFMRLRCCALSASADVEGRATPSADLRTRCCGAHGSAPTVSLQWARKSERQILAGRSSQQ